MYKLCILGIVDYINKMAGSDCHDDNFFMLDVTNIVELDDRRYLLAWTRQWWPPNYIRQPSSVPQGAWHTVGLPPMARQWQ